MSTARPLRVTFLYVALLSLISACGGVVAQPGSVPPQAAIDAFAATLQAEVDSTGVGGLTAAVLYDGEVVWAEGFGWADRARAVPADAETLYRTGSISKSMTAVLMMQLVDAGVLDLDAPVASVLPEIEGVPGYADHPPITFRQLASHTAGLVREPDLPGAAAGPLSTWADQVLASIPTLSYLGPPGAQYAYSNIGYGLLGLALERAAGEPFMDAMHAHLFDPLGMAASTFAVPTDRQAHLATGYANFNPNAPANTELPLAEHAGRGYKVPNGGVYATSPDLARFALALTTADYLSAESRAELMRVHSPLGLGEPYGLGFILTPAAVDGAPTRLVWHDGAVAGYRAMLMVHPESGTGVVWMLNYNRGTLNLDRAASQLVHALATHAARR